MKIMIIEDDPYTKSAIRDVFEEFFPNSELNVLSSVSELKRALDDGLLTVNPPDLIVVDMILRWSRPAPHMPEIPVELQPYEMSRAGFKCIELLRATSGGGPIPVILHTMLTAEELRGELRIAGPNVYHVVKDENPQPLVNVMRRILTDGVIEPSQTVFLVHGHDTEARDTVARFVERLGFTVVILDEQESRNRTIIKKFEDHANVAFAIVLLTPDDVGGSKGTPNQLKPRARQNVIFELGFFIGKLGRHRVCAIIRDDVEILSDYAGVIYIELDSHGGWKTRLAREMKSAGLVFDFSRLI
jgi:predicted nucleotide-binding protein